LDEKLASLQSAPTESVRQQRAEAAEAELGKVSRAFSESQPKSLQAARQTDALKPSEETGFAQGMTQLDALLKQLQQQRSVAPVDQAKQARQALSNLQTGMRSQFGQNVRGEQLLQKLEQMLEGEQPVDPGELNRLVQDLERFSMEAATQLAEKGNQPEALNIDPASLPPPYRGRIQKYFQKLSER